MKKCKRSSAKNRNAPRVVSGLVATPDLDGLELANRHLLDTLRSLTFTVQNNVRRAVDYRNLDSEELGSVYESLLELHPQVNVAAATFVLTSGAGSDRKPTGSH